MDKNLLKAFWNCGDNQIIEFALVRSRLNRLEREVVKLTLDECRSQEEIAEEMGYSTRKIQDIWYSASAKLLGIPWVYAYATELAK